MVEIVHYEVYLFSNGSWQLHGRYPSDQRKHAFEDAKNAEDSMRIPSKIVRENYNSQNNSTDETVIYLSDKIRSFSATGRASSGDYKPGGKTLMDSLREQTRAQQQQSEPSALSGPTGAIIKLVGIIILSIALAAVISGTITALVSSMSAGTPSALSPSESSRILFGVFIAVFLFSALPLAAVFVPWNELNMVDDIIDNSLPSAQNKQNTNASTDQTQDDSKIEVLSSIIDFTLGIFGITPPESAKKETTTDTPQKNTKKDNDEQKNKEDLERLNRFSLDLDDDDMDTLPVQREPDPVTENGNDSNDFFLDDDEAHDIEKAAIEQQKQAEKIEAKKKAIEELAAQRQAEEEAKYESDNKKDTADKKKNQPEEKDEDEDEDEDEEYQRLQDDTKTEETRRIIMKFLTSAVAMIKTKHHKIDTFGKFGINLALAGAAETLRLFKDLEEESYNKILIESIQTLGTNETLARAFTNKLPEYSLEPRYLSMLQAGNDAMEKLLHNAPDPYEELMLAYDNWHNPLSKADKQPGIVTVMFTDMVGSTNSTQHLGDTVAQKLVRTHNRIVRDALTKFNGKEVKHTGDEIMASFTSSSSAVEASIEIQKKMYLYNAENPDLPLTLRIGLNAGEPIVEDDDLFGTTVQIAARVCDAAGEGQIFVSNVVRELAAGKTQQFYSLGPTPLKGIREPQLLFEVLWFDEDFEAELSEGYVFEDELEDNLAEHVQTDEDGYIIEGQE